MANFIEALIGNPVKRQDEKRLKVTLRPAPDRPRPLLELFIAMGSTASFQALRRSIDLKAVDPAIAVFAILGRWPTKDEAASFDTPYEAWPHMMRLMQSQEFRRHFPRRVMEAFPERRRLLYVRIPASGGDQVLDTLNSKHPVLPADLHDKRFDNPGHLAQTMGNILTRMNVSNALALVRPDMAVFCTDPSNVDPARDTLNWHISMPGCRPGDLLFTVFREPADRALAAVNAACADFRNGKKPIPPELHQAAGLSQTSLISALTTEEWRRVARAFLATSVRKNPVCHALGDGTSTGALADFRRAPIHLVPTEQFRVWGRTALDVIPADPSPLPESVLGKDDLTATDRDVMDQVTCEDRILHTRMLERLKATSLPSAPGREI